MRPQYRFKTIDNIDAYGSTDNVIHCKFGDMRKHYNFTKEFQTKHPNFCKEYEKYFMNQKSKFTDPLVIVNYVERFGLPVRFYSNMCDQEFADFDAVREWICNEYMEQGCHTLYDYESGKGYIGLDQEKCTV